METHHAAVRRYGMFQHRAECSCMWVGRTRWTHTSAQQDLDCHTAGRVAEGGDRPALTS
jgi:hypothetical protein